MNDSLPASGRGRVVGGLPYSLDRHDPVTIGSDRDRAIVIDGADPHHAELRWDADRKGWVLYDDPAPSETCVNGRSVESCQLREGDWFEVAGVRICFANGKLVELDPDRPVGLRVTVRHVSATAGGRQRLDNISFQAVEGDFVALLGPSGCGKSTLIQRIAGLAPFEGDILFNGHDLRAEKGGLLPLVAYLPQAVEETLHADMTVHEAMADFVKCHLAEGSRPDFASNLKDVGLPYAKIASTPVGQLSGGMKRRLAFALALMRDPQLLLLDEPTAGLDPASEAGIMELLRSLADQGRTVICATHVLYSLDRCDKVVMLVPGGRLAFFGAPVDACRHFEAEDKDWLSVYKKLEGSGGATAADVPEDSPRRLPTPPPAASFASAFRATLGRLIHAVCSKRNAPLFLGNPIGIALALAFACGKMFGKGGDIETVCFCMSVAMFWLGLSGAVRNLVSERVPKRCLDRMRGMPLSRYFAAQVAFVAISLAVQSALFVLTVFLLRHHPDYFSPSAMPALWFVLTLIGFAGGCVGLAVSAFAKKEIQAVWALPFVAILALFLSKPVLESNGDAPSGYLKAIECAMPTFYTQECLNQEIRYFRVGNPDVSRRTKARRDFWFLAVSYPVVFLLLAFWFQHRREEAWDGR